ncbi:hypothetical protein GGR56DRAFT_646890 [Xylariaceae sp. FL0804]|nr:hypothetical protein GGR56DRAFT_646890 [Xylariaceae sp. FL0804]
MLYSQSHHQDGENPDFQPRSPVVLSLEMYTSMTSVCEVTGDVLLSRQGQLVVRRCLGGWLYVGSPQHESTKIQRQRVPKPLRVCPWQIAQRADTMASSLSSAPSVSPSSTRAYLAQRESLRVLRPMRSTSRRNSSWSTRRRGVLSNFSTTRAAAAGAAWVEGVLLNLRLPQASILRSRAGSYLALGAAFSGTSIVITSCQTLRCWPRSCAFGVASLVEVSWMFLGLNSGISWTVFPAARSVSLSVWRLVSTASV